MSSKTVMITGASAGFGEATARLLAESKHKLILVARREEQLKKLAKELDTETHVAAVDVRDRVAVEKLFADLPAAFASIDVLVNNAGLALGLGGAQDADLDDWDMMVDTNVKGMMYFARLALENMKKRDAGLIINIGSVAASAPYPGGNIYGATKAFVAQFTRNLRADLFGTSIKVSNIEPGASETEFSMVRFKGDAKKAAAVYEGARTITAEDIAETIEWIMTRPLRMNVDSIQVMPLDQTYAGLKTYRGE